MTSAENVQAQKATAAIKQLLAANAKLQSDLDAARLLGQQSLEEHCRLKKKYNEIVTKESSVVAQLASSSGLGSPSLENKASDVEKLAEQNIALKKKLQSSYSPNEVQEFVERNEFNSIIQQYREIIKQKNKEIAFFKRNSCPSDLRIQVSQLEKALQRTNAVKDAYITEISSLQTRLAAYEPHTQEEATTPQAASDDADPNTSSSSCSFCNLTTEHVDRLECEKKVLLERLNGVLITRENEIKALKQECSSMAERLNEAISNEKETQFKLDEAIANAMQFQDDNDRLLREKAQLVTSSKSAEEQHLQAQLKVYEEDFDYERKEKERTYDTNQKLMDENSMLKRNLESMSQMLHSKQSDKLSGNSQTPRSPLDHHRIHTSATYPESFTHYGQDPTTRMEDRYRRPPQPLGHYHHPSERHRDANHSGLNLQIRETDHAPQPDLQSAPPHHQRPGGDFLYSSQLSQPAMPYSPSYSRGRVQPDSQSTQDQCDLPSEISKEENQGD